jgi:hypothetical protein
MAFWVTQMTDQLKDPKRKFRFLVTIGGIDTTQPGVWYAKTVTKPSFQISAAEHKYLNHTLYYPGSVTWQDVTLTLADPANPDMTATFADIIEASGYVVPSTSNELMTLSKGQSVSALGSIEIAQLDANGNELETWTLMNPWLTDVKYGDLAYGDDELTEISLTFKYDWATLKSLQYGSSRKSTTKSAAGSEFLKQTSTATAKEDTE